MQGCAQAGVADAGGAHICADPASAIAALTCRCRRRNCTCGIRSQMQGGVWPPSSTRRRGCGSHVQAAQRLPATATRRPAVATREVDCSSPLLNSSRTPHSFSSRSSRAGSALPVNGACRLSAPSRSRPLRPRPSRLLRHTCSDKLSPDGRSQPLVRVQVCVISRWCTQGAQSLR
jgi:hypothetical protein